jgi:AraC-like DNA-binding protein
VIHALISSSVDSTHLRHCIIVILFLSFDDARSGYKVDTFGHNKIKKVPTKMKTLTINGIAQLIKIGSEYGLASCVLLKGSGISKAMLSDPYASIQPAQEFRVIHNLQAATGFDDLGLIVGKRFHLSVLGVLGATVPTAASVREAIKLFIAYIQLSYTYFKVSFEESPLGGKIILADQYDLGDLRRFFIDRDTMFTVNAFRELFPLSSNTDEIAVKLGYEAPVQPSKHAQELQCAFEFAEGRTYISLSKQLLEQTLPQSNELTLKLLEQQCKEISQKLSGSQTLAEQVQHLLLESIQTPLSLEDIAHQLGVSSRTVRRKLNLENSNYKQLLMDLRKSEAKRLLKETRWSIERIAEHLGYSETSGFNHAFKKWTDLSPNQYRKQ